MFGASGHQASACMAFGPPISCVAVLRFDAMNLHSFCALICVAADKLEAAEAERPGFFAATKVVL